MCTYNSDSLNAPNPRCVLSSFQHSLPLLLALVQPERLTKRLLQIAVDASITPTERNERLQALQQQLTRLRYKEGGSDLRGESTKWCPDWDR